MSPWSPFQALQNRPGSTLIGRQGSMKGDIMESARGAMLGRRIELDNKLMNSFDFRIKLLI